MSKKTRQEKIIADLRRQLSTTKIDNPVVTQRTITLEKETKPIISHQSQTSIPIAPSASLPLIKKDLIKTLILSILAIFFELVLYFLLKAGQI